MVVHNCECCSFSTMYKHVLNSHFKSKRHIELSKNPNENTKYYICMFCNKKYRDYSGLWRHRKDCKQPEIQSSTMNPSVLDKLNEIQNQIVPLLQNKIINQHVLATTENELETNKKRIQLLEKTYLKKQKRTHFIDNNVVYIVTTEDNKLRRNYIVGKAKNLTHRLSTYNKTSDHEVIHYKKCPDESTMNIIESMVMKKLEKYRECANRDRFILPENTDISLFTNIINSCVAFFTEDNEI